MKVSQFYKMWLSPQRWLDRMGMRPPMQIVVGLVLLLASVLQIAQALQLVPNEDMITLRGRTVLAEMISSRVASLVANSDSTVSQKFLQAIVRDRNDILSVGLRKLDGTLLFQTSDHERYWAKATSEENTATHMHILLNQNNVPWGRLEIAFRPLHAEMSWKTWVGSPWIRLAAFILGSAFVLFWLFMSRMLRVLDPSAAVPEHMQLMIDTLVEGLVIIDNDGRIVMANEAFSRLAFLSADRLMGRALSSLTWTLPDNSRAPEAYPWQAVELSNLPERGTALHLQIGPRHDRRLNVNASPILDSSGDRHGIVVTFDDQTIVESDNLQLAELVAKFGAASADFHQLREQLRSFADFKHLEELQELANSARDLVKAAEVTGANNLIAMESAAETARKTESN